MIGISSIDDPRLFAVRKQIGLFSNTLESAKALHNSGLSPAEQGQVLSDAREGMRGLLGTTLKLTLPFAGALGGHMINGLRKRPEAMSPEAMAGTTAGYVAADEFSNWYARNKVYAIKDHLHRLRQEKPVSKVASATSRRGILKIAADPEMARMMASNHVGYLVPAAHSARTMHNNSFSPEGREQVLSEARANMGSMSDFIAPPLAALAGGALGDALSTRVPGGGVLPAIGAVAGGVGTHLGLRSLREKKLNAIREELARLDSQGQ